MDAGIVEEEQKSSLYDSLEHVGVNDAHDFLSQELDPTKWEIYFFRNQYLGMPVAIFSIREDGIEENTELSYVIFEDGQKKIVLTTIGAFCAALGSDLESLTKIKEPSYKTFPNREAPDNRPGLVPLGKSHCFIAES